LEALVRAFEKFLMRDLVFIVGGAAIIMSFLFVYNHLPTKEWPTAYYFLCAGIAYGIGYAVQDLLVLLRISRSKAGHRPNWLGKFLFWLSDREKAENIEKHNYDDAKRDLYKKSLQRVRDDHERTESLKQVGMTLGPCFFLAGVIIWSRSWLIQFEFEQVLAISAIGFGVALWLLGWLKVTQQGQYMLSRQSHKTHSHKNNRSVSFRQKFVKKLSDIWEWILQRNLSLFKKAIAEALKGVKPAIWRTLLLRLQNSWKYRNKRKTT
jgi:hypothetical protein